MRTEDDPIAAFWSLFRERATELATTSSADSPVYDELLDELQQIEPRLYLEFSSSDPDDCELIITAEGRRELFSMVRTIVAAAPDIPKWTVRALKPKLGFPKATSWNDVTLAIDGIVFEPLESGSKLGLRLFVPGIAASDVDDAHNALLRALDHGLGEERLANAVEFTEVRPMPSDAVAGDHIPLHDLEKFIDFCASRRVNAG